MVASRASRGARLAVLAFAAVGHYAFLASLCGNTQEGPWYPLALAAPNVLVLAGFAFARPQAAWLRPGPTWLAVAGSTAAIGALAITGARPGGNLASQVAGGLVLCACGGVTGGLLGATVAVPLSRAIERWRADPAPRRALDVWATLACMAAVFAVTRPVQHLTWGETPLPTNHPAFVRVLGALDLALAALALAIAAAVFALDLALRRTIARAHAVALDGRPATDPATASAGGVSLATMHDEELVALVGTPGEASYRAAATGEVLALLPRAPRLSWRLVAMPCVALVCALGLACCDAVIRVGPFPD
ncbi:MAG: hypothetical protein JWM10_782 [Myxococcaceae bacterium]|nr:hypothetical protein [Myxococcaceae bacterium]